MRPGFGGEVEAFGLNADDLVVDLGCGTGQLTVPLAARVGAVVGMDPAPDMVVLARRTAERSGVANTAWVLGADRDLPALGAVLGDRTVGAVTIAVAVHWMDRDPLFRAARALLRTGGGIAVVTNGTPLWLFSALSVDRLPSPESRAEFAAMVSDALRQSSPFVERVRVSLQFGVATAAPR